MQTISGTALPDTGKVTRRDRKSVWQFLARLVNRNPVLSAADFGKVTEAPASRQCPNATTCIDPNSGLLRMSAN